MTRRQRLVDSFIYPSPGGQGAHAPRAHKRQIGSGSPAASMRNGTIMDVVPPARRHDARRTAAPDRSTIKTAPAPMPAKAVRTDTPAHQQQKPDEPAVPPQRTAVRPASQPVFRNLRVSLTVFGVIVLVASIVSGLLSGQKSLVWFSLLMTNVVGTVGFNILVRRSSMKHADPWFTAAVMATGLAIPFVGKELVAPIHFPAFSTFDMLLLAVATLACVSLQICNVMALKYLEASVFSVIYNSRIIFATLFGLFFLSESVGVWALLGGLLIFTAVFVVRQKGKQSVTKHGVLFALGAAVSMSVMNTCEKRLIQLVGYEQYILPMLGTGAVIMWIIICARRTKVSFSLLVRPQNLLLMLLRACAGIGFSYALVFGPVAVSSYISSLSVVLLVIIGMLFLGERDYVKPKIIATIMAIMGLTFILIDKTR